MSISSDKPAARLCADDLITIAADTSQKAQSIAHHLRQSGRWLEVVPGIDSVVVQFDATDTDPPIALAILDADLAAIDSYTAEPASLIEIPVRYGGEFGPDLDIVCAALRMTADKFVGLHCGREFVVEMLGFTPGFAYVSGRNDWHDIRRLATPRQHVAAGSVGIASGRSGIYALPGPGGWPLVGRTDLGLFNAAAEAPFLLRPGTRLRFVAVDSPL